MVIEESPLLIKYKKQYDKNPRSTIFAPLAELYRKLGLLEQALEILREGIRNNPSYLMGYLILGSCYFDQGQFPMAYATLRPLVDTNKDNLRLLKLFSRICFELGHNEEALESYKYLLFLNPRDNEVALKVRELEDRERPVVQSSIESSYFKEANLSTSPGDDLDQWTQVDFGNRAPAVVEDNWHAQEIDEVEFDEEARVLEFETSLKESKREEVAPPVDIYEPEQEEIEDTISIAHSNSQPIVTHTLVDLYCAQGYYAKAREILSKILELNPTDRKSLDRMAQIEKSIVESSMDSDTGDDAILAALDERLADEEVNRSKLKEEKLLQFLDGVKRRSCVKRDFLK